MSGLASRRPSLRRLVVIAVVAGFGVGVVASGLWSSPSAEPTVQTFLLDWQQGAYAAAAALTTGKPAEVAKELREAYRGLNAPAFYLSMGSISQHGGAATASFAASVDLGQNGAPWNYEGQFFLRNTSGGWRIDWSPSVINPGLRPGLHLAMISSTPHRKPLLDSSGQPLQTESATFEIGVEPGNLAHPVATANALGRVTGLDHQELLGWILAAPRNSFDELVVLSPSQYHRIARRLHRVPGLIVQRHRLRLFKSIAPAIVGSVGTEVSAALRDQGIAYRPGATVGLSGLQQHFQRKLAGTPSTQVVAETASGQQKSVLATWDGSPPTAVHTTIDSGVQTAASDALVGTPGSMALVAVQPSTGHILAVAAHGAPGLPQISPLSGQYPPAGAFTIVSAEALLATGLGVDTPVRCTSLNDVGGRNFRNVPGERGLGGGPTFAKDFAHVCGTALAGLSRRLTGRDLDNAGAAFGMGQPWQLPLPSFSGRVAASGSVAQIASDTIGEGSVLASPLGMAMVAAEVDSGSLHQPALVVTPGDPPRSRTAPFAATEISSLRDLMRGTVRSGAATRANLPGQHVYGQVGTARMQDGKHKVWVHWFVGYRGDLAFAVLRITRVPGMSAVPVAARFLTATPAP